MKKLWLLTLLVLFPVQVFAARSTGVTDNKTWITVDSITWTMDAIYTVGQYVNLDYYVVCPSGCSVTAISPTPTNKIGTMKNPQPGDTQGIFQADPPNDTLYVYYSSAMNVGLSLPISLVAGDNIISTTPHTYTTGDATVIQEAAILNVVASAPAANSFRPGICDRSVSGYTESNIDYDVFADLSHVTGQPTMSTIADKFIRLWLDFSTVTQTNRVIRPVSNQEDYASDASTVVSTGSMMLNMAYTNAEKRTLAVGMIQQGLDIYSMILQGREWAADGGHNGGRMLPFLIAGAALHEQSMLDVFEKAGDYCDTAGFSTYPADCMEFGETTQITYIKQAHIDCSNDPECWNPYENSFGNTAMPYTQDMLGMPEYSIRMGEIPEWAESSWTSGYRFLNNPSIPGQMLAVMAMGHKTTLDKPSLFDYADRAMYITTGRADPCGYTVANEAGGYSPSSFIVNVYAAHRATFGDLCQGSAGPPPPTPTAKIRYRFPGGALITEATE